MVVCKYFLRGFCRFGQNCRYSHSTTDSTRSIKPEDVVVYDLTTGKPLWPLSCYGLTVDWMFADNILKGDISPEELRLEAYTCPPMNFEEYKKQVLALVNKAAMNINECIANPSKAIMLSLKTQQSMGINHPESVTIQTIPLNTEEDVPFTFGEIPEIPPT